MKGDYAALEAARVSRDDRDLTAAASPARASAPFAYKGVVVHRHEGRARSVSADGLRFEYEGTEGARRNVHGGGFGYMTAEKRRAVSRKANAARWAK